MFRELKINAIYYLYIHLTIFILVVLPFKCESKIWTYTRLTDNNYGENGIAIEGEQIVYIGVGERIKKRTIFIQNLKTGKATELFNSKDNEFQEYYKLGFPSLNSGKVAWRAWDDVTDTDTIFFWDGENIKKIVTYECGSYDIDGFPPSYGSIEPSLWGNKIAFAAWDGNDYEIFLFQEEGITQITDNDHNDYEPQLWENNISWTSEEGGIMNIYFWDGTGIINASNMPKTNEDSDLHNGLIAFTGYGLEGDYKTDIFLYNGLVTFCVIPLIGYDYEPEIGKSSAFITWTGWPDGKSTGDISVGWAFDGYKLFNLYDQKIQVGSPRADGKYIIFLLGIGAEKEIYAATYITGSLLGKDPYSAYNGILVNGDIVFLTNNCSELSSIDISSISQPLCTNDFLLSEGIAATDIVQNGNFLFIANRESGVKIIDISDENNPLIVSTIPSNDKATHLQLQENILYLGDKAGGLRIFDVQNPLEPEELSNLDLGQTYGVAIRDDYAYVANYWNGITVLDTSIINSPVAVGSFDSPGRKIWDVSIRDEYAYLLCPGYGILVLYIDDPSLPVLVGECPFPDGSTTGYFAGPLDIIIKGNYAFVSNGTKGVLVLDIKSPEQTAIIERIDTPGYAWGINISGNYIFVADGKEGFHSINISDYIEKYTDLDADLDYDGADLCEIVKNFNDDFNENDLECFAKRFGSVISE